MKKTVFPPCRYFSRTSVAALVALTVSLGSAFGATSVSQFGITWTFDKDYPVGQFCNGDYWVVGPAKITAITNSYHTSGFTPSAGQDGSMINPPTTDKQGYDNRLDSYQAGLNVAATNPSVSSPLQLNPGMSLVSSVSWLYTSEADTEPGCPSFNGGTGTPRPIIRTAAILTCLNSAPPEGSFRPPYCGSDKTVRFNKSDLRYDRLKSLAPVASTPALTSLESMMTRPWIDHVHEYLGAFVHPSENMPQYGADLSTALGEVSVMLHLDFSQLPGNPSKEKLLIGFVQVGIDLAGIADNGGGWPSNGGHQMGRKWPVLFAGQMLDDAHMKNAGQWTTDFQEDLDTFYVSQAEVDMTHSAAWNPDDRASRRAYETADIGLPEWGIRHTAKPETDNMAWDATYRSINNPAYVGWVLAAHMMGQKQAWNHAPLFDYIDRSTAIGGSGSFGGDFIKNMWQTYRADYSPRWIPYNPSNLYSQGQLYYALEIATAGQLPTGKVDEAYSQTLNAAAGKPPYTWAVTAGSLPSGLGLVANSGSITGTPVTAVITSFSIKVTDSAGASVTNTFSLTVLAGLTSITTTNILADPADRSIGLNTNGIPVLGAVSQAAHNIADDNAAYSKADQCAVIMFKLPVLETGETISTANLALDISAGNIGGGPDPLPKGVDIYGLRYSSSSTVLTNDYGFKTLTGANDTLIQDNIVQFPSNIVYAYTVYNTDTAGDAALAAWLTAQYTAGAAGGDYVFLRIHADSRSANQIYITSANSTSTSNTVPTLTLGIRTMTAGGTDTDGDGIPNDWETLHFGGSTNANPDAMAANGVNTIYESFIAGLNPTNAQSVFALSGQQAASRRVLQWGSVSGRVYSVHWATNMLSGFQALETNILWPQNSWTDAVHGAEAGGFYRLKVQLRQ